MNVFLFKHQGKKLLSLGFTQKIITSRYEIKIYESEEIISFLCINFFTDYIYLETLRLADDEYFQLPLPHIKTFNQLKKIYFALTKKKLCKESSII